MNTWQICPKCHGTGQTPNFYEISTVNNICNLCNGTKIISTFTGLPPQSGIPTSNTEKTEK